MSCFQLIHENICGHHPSYLFGELKWLHKLIMQLNMLKMKIILDFYCRILGEYYLRLLLEEGEDSESEETSAIKRS